MFKGLRKNKRKINWENIILLVILIGCVSVVLHDLYVITILPWFNGDVLGWTWFGLFTFIIALIFAINIFDYFLVEIRNN